MLRRDLIDVAARAARHGHGHITLHLPEEWHRDQEWMNLFEVVARAGPAVRVADPGGVLDRDRGGIDLLDRIGGHAGGPWR